MASSHVLFDVRRFVSQEARHAAEEDSDESRPATRGRLVEEASAAYRMAPLDVRRFVDGEAARAAEEDSHKSRPATRERLSSLVPLRPAEEVSAAYSRPPRRVRVGGASQYFRPECNGVFDLLRMHNDRPLYRSSAGAIVYFDRHWKLNHEPSTTGWSFVSKGAPWLVPPQGMWAPVDQASGEPILAHVPSDPPPGQFPPVLPCIEPSPRTDNRLSPHQFVVSGSDIPECNGAYALAKTHHFRPLYRAPSGAILYFHTTWRINVDGRTSGWAFWAPGGPAPPEVGWVPVDPCGRTPAVSASGPLPETAIGPRACFQDVRCSPRPPGSPSKTRPRRMADVSGSFAVRNSDYEHHKKHGSNALYTAPLRRRLVEQWLSESREPARDEAVEQRPW